MTCNTLLKKLYEIEDKEQYVIIDTSQGVNEYNFIYLNEIQLVWNTLFHKYNLYLTHNTNINDKFLTVNDIITYIEKWNNKVNILKLYVERNIYDGEKNRYIPLMDFNNITKRKDNIMLT